MNGRTRIIAHIRGEPVDRLPVMPITMQFAAELSGVSYLDYATDFEALARAQSYVAERFEFDHVSVISDPTREAEACGAAVEYYRDQPPALRASEALLADKASLRNLAMPDILGENRMHDRVRGVAALRAGAGRARLVEGWVEGPCAQACNLRGIHQSMLDLIDDPGFFRELAAFTVEMELAFAEAQIRSGADVIGIGDAAASLIGPQLYGQHVYEFEKRLVDGIHALGAMVRMHICGNTGPLLHWLGELGCEIVDLDHMVAIGAARDAMGPGQIILGNCDPVNVLLRGDEELVRTTVGRCHEEAGERFIIGAGCEIPPGTPRSNVKALAAYSASHALDRSKAS